jgi:outer membrane protein assembly factor BamB
LIRSNLRFMHQLRLSLCVIFLAVTIHSFAAPGDLKFTYPGFNPPAISTNGDLLMANQYSFESRTFPSLKTNWSLFEFQGFEGPTILNEGTAFAAHYYLDGKMSKIYSVYAFDVATGARKGTFPISSANGITADGILIVNGVRAFSVASQKLLWTNNLTYVDTSESLAIGPDGTLYLRGRGVTAVDHLSGRVLWSFPFVDPTAITYKDIPGYPPVSVGPDSTIYFGSHTGTFYALNPDGTLRWDFIAAGMIGGSAVISRENIVYLASQNGVYALDGQTGAELWNYPLTNQTIYASPALTSDGTLYVGCDALLALDASNGRLKWSSPHPSGKADISVHPDGTILLSGLALEGTAPLAAGGWTKARKDLANSSSWQSVGAPVILYSTGRTPVVNGNLHFQVTASGTPPLSYQWFKNGAPILNATNRDVIVAAGLISDLYTVTVSNAFDSVTSPPGQRAFTLLVHSVGGTVLKSEDMPLLTNGSVVHLTAQAPTNRLFLGWTGGINSQENTLTLAITNDLVVDANFETHPGDLLWKVRVGLTWRGFCPTVEGNRVFALSDLSAKSFSLRYGDLKWSYFAGWGQFNEPIVRDGMVYIPNPNGLTTLNSEDGSVQWHSPYSSFITPPAVARDGTTFIASGGVTAVDRSGKLKWKFDNGNAIGGPASIGVDGTVYIAGNDSYLYWFTPSGDLKGRVSFSGGFGGQDGFAIPVGQRVIGYYNYVDLQTHASAPLGFVFNVSPIVAGDGLLYFANNNSYTSDRPFAIESSSLTRHVVTGIFSAGSTPAMATDGTLYIPQGVLTAFNSINGSTNWVFDPAEREGGTFPPNIADDGTVLFFANRTLYAVKGTSPLGNGWWPKVFCDVGNTSSQESTGPKITKDPAPVEIKPGEPSVFRVEALGTGPVSYTWLSNAAPILGANSSELSVVSTRSDQYSVIVSNISGVVTSRIAYAGYTFNFVTNGGAVTVDPLHKVYPFGTRVRVTANPNRGNEFLKWTGDIESTQNPITFEVTNHVFLEARFSVPPGGLLWCSEAGESYSSPLVGSNLVYVSSDNVVQAFDTRTGQIRWSVHQPFPFGMALANGTTVLVTPLGALDALTGRTLWSVTKSIPESDGQYAITSDGIRFAVERRLADSGILRARNSASGAILGTELRSYFASSPVVGLDNRAFIADQEGLIWRVSTNAAEAPVSVSLGTQIPFAVLAFNRAGTLFAGTPNGIYLIDPGSMTLKGTINQAVVGNLLVDGDVLYFLGKNSAASSASGIVSYSLTHSNILDFVRFGNYPSLSLAEDGNLYTFTFSDVLNLLAYNTTTKRTNWVFRAQSSIFGFSYLASTAAVGPDGTVYFSGVDRLYAVRGTAPLAQTDWPSPNGGQYQTRHARPVTPAISSITKTNSVTALTFQTQLGPVYSVEATADFFSSWNLISSEIGTGSPLQIKDTNSIATFRFYRLRAE